MSRNLSIFAVFVAALALASGTRQPLQAATTPSADVVFIMEAAQATFTNATTLALNGLTSSAQSYGAGAKTGIYPIQNFTDSSASSQYVDSDGQWLSNPQAVMYAVGQDGNVTTVLLTLSNPTTPPQPAAGTTTNNNNNNNGGSTNNNNNGPPQLTFTVALVPADASKVKYQNGVVAAKVAEASTGVGNLAQTITPGATFGPVAFYIDQNQQGLPKKATTKWGGGGWGSWGGGYNGYNNGWNNGWGGSSSNNNNNNNNNNGGYGSSNNNNNNNNNGGYGSSNNNNNNNNNNGGGWGSSNNNNNNNNNGGWGSSNNNNNNNNGK